jgi:hypothetical protein
MSAIQPDARPALFARQIVLQIAVQDIGQLTDI